MGCVSAHTRDTSREIRAASRSPTNCTSSPPRAAADGVGGLLSIPHRRVPGLGRHHTAQATPGAEATAPPPPRTRHPVALRTPCSLAVIGRPDQTADRVSRQPRRAATKPETAPRTALMIRPAARNGMGFTGSMYPVDSSAPSGVHSCPRRSAPGTTATTRPGPYTPDPRRVREPSRSVSMSAQDQLHKCQPCCYRARVRMPPSTLVNPPARGLIGDL